MGCGEARQYRLGEMIAFGWDASGNPTEVPLDLGSAIDLDGANTVAVSVTAISVSLGTGVTSVNFKFSTAPINSTAFYADVGFGGATAAVSVSAAGSQFLSVEGFSRFFALMAELQGSPTSATTIVVTIDVVVRS